MNAELFGTKRFQNGSKGQSTNIHPELTSSIEA